MAPDAWNPALYTRFRDERSLPFHDLLALVQPPAHRVVDLGCGTGELTRLLHDRVGAQETVGVDTSRSMLAEAAPRAGKGLRFQHQDLAAFDGRDLDLVFSNAALQWVPDHPSLIARLRQALAPGGQLAFQVPANHDHPSHVVAASLAREEQRFREGLGGFTRVSPVQSPRQYAELVATLGFTQQQVRLQVYGHWLASRDDVVEWVRGSTLTAYQERMPPELWDDFLARYRARLLPQLPDTRPFFFAFPRILVWARI